MDGPTVPNHLKPDLSLEIPLWKKGVSYVAGIDEAGRGAIAGPVAAAAVILPAEPSLMESLWGVNDSKKMSPKSRDFWAGELKEICLDYGVGYASHNEIDRIGIAPATHLAIGRALKKLELKPEHILIDYLVLKGCNIPQTSITKGDTISLSIAAASIIAKTSRDALMRQRSKKYPGYNFDHNKGYGTLFHRNALASLGACPIHRKSFKIRGIDCENTADP
jgi:ribonuclease HII